VLQLALFCRPRLAAQQQHLKQQFPTREGHPINRLAAAAIRNTVMQQHGAVKGNQSTACPCFEVEQGQMSWITRRLITSMFRANPAVGFQETAAQEIQCS
jgi:hypothetical protein